MSHKSKSLRAMTLAGLMLAGTLSAAAPAHAADPVDPNSALSQCGTTSTAFVFDQSRSFTSEEIQLQKDAAKQSIEKLSGIPGAKITFFTFALSSPVNHSEVVWDEHGWETPGTIDRTLPQNAPSNTFDISTPEGAAAANAWLDNMDRESRDYPRVTEDGSPNRDTEGVNGQILGTNWEAGLKAVQDYQNANSMKFNQVIFTSDGSPNRVLDENGQAIIPAGEKDPATDGYQQAFDEAKAVANQLENGGTNVIPFFVQGQDLTPGDQWAGDVNAQIAMMASLAHESNPVEGVDYFTTDLASMATNIYNAATSTCPTDLKINKDVDQATVNYDGSISFPLTAINDGEWDEGKASLTDEGVVFTNKTTGESITVKDVTLSNPSKGSISGANWNIGLLKAGETATATATAKVPDEVAQWFDADISANNSAFITGARDPYNPNTPHQPNSTIGEDTDNWDDATVKITPAATPVSDVKVEKHVVTPKSDLKPGGAIEWEINGINDSEVDDPKVVSNDILSEDDAKLVEEGTFKVEVVEGDGTYDAATNTYTDANGMVAGETFTLKVTATLADDASLANGLTNRATISGQYDPLDPNGQCEPNNGDVKSDQDNCDVTVTKIDSQVKIYKEQVSQKLVAGEEGTWKLNVGASGADDATGVFLAEMPLKGIDADTVKFGTPSQGEIVKGSVLIEQGLATADEVEADKLYWLIGTLASGETASVDVTARVSEGATDVENSALVASTWDKYTGGEKDNNSLEEDDDNYDKVTGTVDVPVVPETPAPSETPEVVVPPADPSAPATPANPAQPAQPETVTTVKGHNAPTGEEQTVMGMSLPVAGAVGGLLILAAAGGLTWVLSPRKSSKA